MSEGLIPDRTGVFRQKLYDILPFLLKFYIFPTDTHIGRDWFSALISTNEEIVLPGVCCSTPLTTSIQALTGYRHSMTQHVYLYQGARSHEKNSHR